MRSAADILNTPSAMQVRFLEYLTGLGRVSNPKVLFFPADFKSVAAPKGTLKNNPMI